MRTHRSEAFSTLAFSLHYHKGAESERIKFLTKNLRSAIVEFRKRALQNIQSISELTVSAYPVSLQLADAQRLPVETPNHRLIVTSPPYAVNAIDYMRATSFRASSGQAMDWNNHRPEIHDGGELTASFTFETTNCVIHAAYLRGLKQRLWSDIILR
ncbi:MAG: hypothetical protein IPM07_30365 [Anaerolineales bacterium]|nr:hypothetical protein [Anaerolineales bacterium]